MNQQTADPPLDSTRYDYHVDGFDDSTHYGRLLQLVGRNKRVLELGCSTGYLSEAMTRHFDCEVTAVEVDEKAAREAEGKCKRVIVGDLDSSSLDDLLSGEAFDVVLCADVLEHLRNPLRVLRAVRDLLAPGGCVVASIPNVAHGSVRLALLHGQFPYRPMGLLDETHVRFFNRATIEELFEYAGFKIDYVGRNRWSIFASETGAHLPDSAREFLELMRSDIESETYQFIVKANIREPHTALGEVQAKAIGAAAPIVDGINHADLPGIDVIVLESGTAKIDELYRRYLKVLNYPSSLRRFIFVPREGKITASNELNAESLPYGQHDFRSYRFLKPGEKDKRFLTDGSDVCANAPQPEPESIESVLSELRNEYVLICDTNSCPTAEALQELVRETRNLGANKYIELRRELPYEEVDNVDVIPSPVFMRRDLLVKSMRDLYAGKSVEAASLLALNQYLRRSSQGIESRSVNFFSVGFVPNRKKEDFWSMIRRAITKVLSIQR